MVSTTVTPSAFISCTSSHSWRRSSTSTPAVGSSSTSTGGCMHQRLGDQQPPFHAARQRARIGAGLVLQMHRAQDFHAAAQGLGDAIEPRLVLQHLEGGEEGVEHHFLRDDADRALGVAQIGVDVETPDRGAARGFQHQAGQDVDQRRFARAIGAEQAEDAALGYIEADAAQRQLAAIALGAVARWGVAFDEVTDRNGGGQGHALPLGGEAPRRKEGGGAFPRQRGYRSSGESSSASLVICMRERLSRGFRSTAAM